LRTGCRSVKKTRLHKIQDTLIDTRGFKDTGNGKITTELSTSHVSNIPAGGFSPDITVKIKIPAIPSAWAPEVIFGNGYASGGVILFKLDDQKLTISKDFSGSMSELFPHDPLPDLFVPGDSAKKSVTTQKVIIKVEYPIFPLIVVASLGLLLLGSVIGFFVVMRREKVFRVTIDGVQKSYGLKPFGVVALKDQQGARIGVLKRGLGQASPSLDKGKTNSVRVS
jgi:hypothetical protein